MPDCGSQPPAAPYDVWLKWYYCWVSEQTQDEQVYLLSPGANPNAAAFVGLNNPPPIGQSQSSSGSTPTQTTPVKTTSTTSPSAPGLKPLDEFGGEGAEDFGEYCWANPEDPICGLIGAGYGITGTFGSGGGVVDVIQGGVSAIDVNAIVDSSLSGLWATEVGAVDAALSALVGSLLLTLTGIGNALKAMWGALTKLAGLILALLSTLWNSIVKGIVAALKEIEQLLKDLVDDVLKPLVDAVQQMRKWLIDLYQNWIRPIILLIQRLRQILGILKLFHIGFATKLDNALADIQARITGPFLQLLGYVNGITNWINLIVTANYLLQKPIFLASLNAYKGEAINLQLNSMNQPLSAAGSAAIANVNSFPDIPTSVSDFDTLMTTGTGDYKYFAFVADQWFQQALDSGGKVDAV